MIEQTPQDRILNEFVSGLQTVFPDIHNNSGGYGYNFHAGSLGDNYCLRKSQYYLDPTGKEYFHLTSYRNLFSIINSGCFRLYNLKNSDDPNELDSFRDAGFVDQGISHYKDRTFILSGCQIADLENTNLWKHYGKVAIVYEFLNDPMHWRNFHFSTIKYERNQRFTELGKLFERMRSKYPHWQFEFDTLPNLIAFHKQREYEWEKEVRLMYIPPLNARLEEFSDFKTSDHHTGYTHYINLPLYVNSALERRPSRGSDVIIHNLRKDFYERTPHLKIKRISYLVITNQKSISISLTRSKPICVSNSLRSLGTGLKSMINF